MPWYYQESSYWYITSIM